jgi:hypothetical protein
MGVRLDDCGNGALVVRVPVRQRAWDKTGLLTCQSVCTLLPDDGGLTGHVENGVYC